MAEAVETLADEALRVKNFLEDYWQFNEFFIDLKGQHPSPSDLIRALQNKRYVCGYAPGHHCFDSCVSACKNLYAENACVTYCGHALGGPGPTPMASAAEKLQTNGRLDVVSFWAHCPMLRKITSFNYHRIQGAVRGHPESEIITVQMEAILTEPRAQGAAQPHAGPKREYFNPHVKWGPKTKRGGDVAISCSLVLIPTDSAGRDNPFGKFDALDVDVRESAEKRKIFRARVMTEVVRVIEN